MVKNKLKGKKPFRDVLVDLIDLSERSVLLASEYAVNGSYSDWTEEWGGLTELW